MKPGDKYGIYDVIRLIGKGNMGTVYLMKIRDTGEDVAVKIVPYSDTETARENIATEEKGATLQRDLVKEKVDKRIVKVKDVHYTGRDLNVQMEYVDGTDLNEVVRKSALDPIRAVKIGIELCEMLRSLDRTGRGITHGDLKPRNIRVLSDDTIKVMDFGIAKESSRDGGTVNLFQTERYSSPERLETTKVNMTSELWSVSVILYEMLAGCHPFQTAHAKMRDRILSDVGPDRLPGSVPQDLCSILHRALSRLPENRYDGPGAMLEDLERFRRGEPVATEESDKDLTERSGAEPPVGSSLRPVFEPSPAFRTHQPSQRRLPSYRRIMASVILLALLIALGSVYRAWSEVQGLSSDIEQGRVALPDAWARFHKITESRFLVIPHGDLDSKMKTMLIKAGERPVDDYRRQQANSNENTWKYAAATLKRALEIDPADETAKGYWYVCQGHVFRIGSKRGTTLVDEKMMNQAIEDFEQASNRIPASPDPYLGLARIYYEQLKDTSKGDQAMEEAKRRGLKEDPAHVVLKAEALRKSGESAEKQAKRFRGVSAQEERKNLEAAREHYQDAYRLYGEAQSDNPTIPPVVKKVLDGLKRVEDRLAVVSRAAK
jgi:serine/threonine protein kinase